MSLYIKDYTPICIMSSSIHLINQGSYGCVFRPSLSCSGKIEQSQRYISKIQLKKRTSENETKVGEKIRTLTRYSHYFAPVIKSCDVQLAVINIQEIRQCDFLQTDEQRNQQYETNKIRYVGSNTLVDYFQKNVDRVENVPLFFKRLLASYVVLLNSLNKLISLELIHFDLKENNIMCKDTTGRPILIDFGVSVMADQFSSENFRLQDAFFAYAPDYDPWCIDICILCYIAKESRSNPDFLTNPVSIAELEPILNQFIESNFLHTDVFQNDERQQFKVDMLTYLRKILGGNMFTAPTWKMVSDALLAHWKTWDNYSLACIYLQMISDFGLNAITNDFVAMLKKIVLAPPDIRDSVDNTMTATYRLFNRVDKQPYQQLQKNILRLFRTPEQIMIRTRKIAATKRKTLLRENELYQNM